MGATPLFCTSAPTKKLTKDDLPAHPHIEKSGMCLPAYIGNTFYIENTFYCVEGSGEVRHVCACVFREHVLYKNTFYYSPNHSIDDR